MKISWIKWKNDENSFNMFKNLGFNVHEVENLDDTDDAIEYLVSNNFKTIIISNDLAGFSSDIIKKYDKSDDINIIITPRKKEK